MGKSDQTRQALRLALRRVETGRVRQIKPGRKLSISAVAEEAGVHPATVHTRYPDIAEQIRQRLNRGIRTQLTTGQQEKEQLRQQTRRLRAELSETRQLLRKMASENARLVIEIEELRALVESERVVRIGS